MQARDLAEVIERFEANRSDMLRLHRGVATHIKDFLSERLAINSRTLMTLKMRLSTVRAELRREKAATLVRSDVAPKATPRP